MLQLSWLLPLAILFKEMSALKKRGYEEIKRGKCPEPRRKERVRREVKLDECPTVELGVQRYPPKRKRKRKYRASHSPQKKLQKCKKGMYPLKRANVELDFHHRFHHYHHHHHTPFIRHTCTS